MRNKRLIIIFSILLAITFAVLLCSIIFSVKTVDTYCYNSDDSALNQRVLEASGIKKGKNIFLMDDQKIIARIEEAVPDAKVINIEQKFPSTVVINYVKLFEYFKITSDEKTYTARRDGRIVSEVDPSVQAIEIRANVSGTLNVGDYLFDSEKTKILEDIVTGFAHLGVDGEAEVASLFEFIDFTKGQKENSLIYLGTKNGPIIKVEEVSNITNAIRYAVSYWQDPDSDYNPAECQMLITYGKNGMAANPISDYQP